MIGKTTAAINPGIDKSIRRLPQPSRMLILLLFFAYATRAPSQQPAPIPSPATPPGAAVSGSVHGSVSDRDGAVYQGVHVILAETASSPAAEKNTTTDSNGRFQFSEVPPGPFQLTVSSDGFATQVIPGSLHAGESNELPAIVLPFATATTEVSVTASQTEVAEAQLKDEEQQRVFGAIPNFYVVYEPNPAPLTARQKFRLAWRTSIDPMTFLESGIIAGIQQGSDEFHGYGQGAEGYAQRFGADYADAFIGGMIGSALLPSLLKQDPRYFYKGTGTTRSRILYAIASSVICKSDKGHWQPNYSGILGGLAAGGISNLYYPDSDRNGLSLTFENAGLGIVGGAAQNLFQEFLVRKLTPKARNLGSSKP
jgi:hypothetical protein